MRSGRPHRSQSGQSTPLVMMMLFVLSFFAALVVDVGQAVNRRVALQVVADAGAFTGASVMATGLNQMAYWNTWMQRLWSAFSWPMTTAWYAGVDLLPCEASDRLEDAYDGVRSGLGVAYHAIAYVYTNYAYLEAKRVTAYNAIDLFPGESIDGSETSLATLEAGNIPYRRNQKLSPLVDTRQVEDGTWSNHWVSTHASMRHAGYVCLALKPIPHPEPRASSYDVWYEKTPSGTPDYFVWVVRAPRTKALMFDELFGGDIIPEMWAAAAARPVGGSIGDGRPGYVAKMVPLSEVMLVDAIWDSVRHKPRQVVH